MTINSRFWGVGWRTIPSYKRKVAESKRRQDLDQGLRFLPSIPGRTARLKAIYLLQIAAEVEHALMAQYLYAAYSLDEALDRFTATPALPEIDRWKRDIRLIARQEMGHFVTVQNLLISLGADIYVNRENNFSDHPDAYPFPVRFERFGLRSIARYVATERPASEEISPGTRAELRRILRLANRAQKIKVQRVGVLYAALYWLFLPTDAAVGPWPMTARLKKCMKEAELMGVHLKDGDFASPADYEEFAAQADEWGVFEDSLHVDEADPRSRALKAIHWIMLQGEGEGPSGAECDQNESHFCRFLNIYRDVVAKPNLLAAARRVPLNPVVPDRHRKDPVHAGAEFITHPESRRWAKLFNIRYQMLLLDTLLALSTSRREDPNLRAMLTEWASRHEMEHLKQIGQLLPTLPRKSGSGNLRAGAPFETAQFPPDNAKRWDMQRVLIKGSNETIRALKKMTTPHDERFAILETISAFDKDRTDKVNERISIETRYDWKSGGNHRIRNQS
jgi:hypothetical protein